MKRTTPLLCFLIFVAVLSAGPRVDAADQKSGAELAFCSAGSGLSEAPVVNAETLPPAAFALPPLPTCSSTCSTPICRGAKVGGFCNSGTPIQGRCSDLGTCPADGKVTCACTTGPPH